MWRNITNVALTGKKKLLAITPCIKWNESGNQSSCVKEIIKTG
jgi:hypothetical protein